MTAVLRCMGHIQPTHLPLPELVKFVFFANLSIVGMNVSLMWNSVGFYQVISRLITLLGHEEYKAYLKAYVFYPGFPDCQALCMIPVS